mgnify:CR=1 FL=1
MPKRSKIFWTSYADLMTSMFFIMLVLFVLAIAMMKKKAKANDDQIKKIENIENAVKNLDKRYFNYNEESKRYKLNVDVKFRSNSYDINDVDKMSRIDLIKAGNIILHKMRELTSENPDVNYLLIVEGNAQKSGQNYKVLADVGYVLSYRRSLSLVNLWKNERINFDSFKNCELLIVGSGYFGKSRNNIKEAENRKFTIQITPKISLNKDE